jgi:hypothetical protein
MESKMHKTFGSAHTNGFAPRGPGLATLVLLFGLFASSCDTGPAGPGQRAENESDDRIDITNQGGSLEGRIEYPDSDVPVDSSAFNPAPGFDGSPPAAAPSAKKINLKLVAEITPPEVAGERVQATSVSIEGGERAMVSYNMRGASRLGAIDWITRLHNTPLISASATFVDSDISAVSWDGTYVYAAESTSAPGFPSPAVFERIKLANDNFTLEENKRIPLTSYVATSALRTSNEIYATSGNGGHVFALDESSLEILGQYPLDDARWAAWDEEGERVVVVQGTPGRISVFAEGEFPNGSMTLLNTFPFPGANVPESKSTADIAGGKAFIAAGPDGVQIVCLDNGQVIGSVPRPDPASLGLDPSVVVTNAVTVDEDLMFISNGEAGVYFARGSEDFTESGCDPQQIDLVGQLVFPGLQSANHVAFDDRHLVIAAGLGGVKVVRVNGH